ncbi:MAG: hypothetical protein JJ974_05520 [Phycisphaerales bacterium]|nr:hypothetical protein [Phycisphaerales bacterium]
MSDIKPWHIVLMVAAVIVLAFTAWRVMGSDMQKGPSGHMTVDVMTGQLYMVQKGKARGVMYPAKHPETGERTLFPVDQEEGSDSWKLSPRLENAITDEMREESKALGSGLRIDILDEDPIVVVIKK